MLGSFDGARQEYPISYREDYGKWEIEVMDCAELLQAIEREYGETDSLTVAKCIVQKFDQNLLLDVEIQDKIRRWQYCRDNPANPAYPGGYDDLPCDWLDFSKIMNEMIQLIMKDQKK